MVPTKCFFFQHSVNYWRKDAFLGHFRVFLERPQHLCLDCQKNPPKHFFFKNRSKLFVQIKRRLAITAHKNWGEDKREKNVKWRFLAWGSATAARSARFARYARSTANAAGERASRALQRRTRNCHVQQSAFHFGDTLRQLLSAFYAQKTRYNPI